MQQVLSQLLTERPEVGYRLLASILLARQPGGAAHVSDSEIAMAALHLPEWSAGRVSLVPLTRK
jgi:hypothetical protein